MATDNQLTSIRNMAQDGRLTMKDVAVVAADMLIRAAREGKTDIRNSFEEFKAAVERVVRDHPYLNTRPFVDPPDVVELPGYALCDCGRRYDAKLHKSCPQC